jgi:hypothetical protein
MSDRVDPDSERPDGCMFLECCFYLVSKGPKCGLHNINDEIRFRPKPGFVFHDSRGVEAGSATELSTVQQFIEERSSAVKDLRTQLHVIWYQCCCFCHVTWIF